MPDGSFKVQVHGVEKATGALRDAILQGMANGMEKIGLRGVFLLQEKSPVGATGNLAHGYFAELHRDGPVLHEVISVSPPADVYALPVDTGTKPHFPPTKALLLWVKQKLHVTNEKQALSVAFMRSEERRVGKECRS